MAKAKKSAAKPSAKKPAKPAAKKTPAAKTKAAPVRDYKCRVCGKVVSGRASETARSLRLYVGGVEYNARANLLCSRECAKKHHAKATSLRQNRQGALPSAEAKLAAKPAARVAVKAELSTLKLHFTAGAYPGDTKFVPCRRLLFSPVALSFPFDERAAELICAELKSGGKITAPLIGYVPDFPVSSSGFRSALPFYFQRKYSMEGVELRYGVLSLPDVRTEALGPMEKVSSVERPIVIVDGFHRWAANAAMLIRESAGKGHSAGVQDSELPVRVFKNEADAIGLAISSNLSRRQMSPGQLAAAADTLYQNGIFKSLDSAAAVFKVSVATLKRFRSASGSASDSRRAAGHKARAVTDARGRVGGDGAAGDFKLKSQQAQNSDGSLVSSPRDTAAKGLANAAQVHASAPADAAAATNKLLQAFDNFRGTKIAQLDTVHDMLRDVLSDLKKFQGGGLMSLDALPASVVKDFWRQLDEYAAKQAEASENVKYFCDNAVSQKGEPGKK